MNTYEEFNQYLVRSQHLEEDNGKETSSQTTSSKETPVSETTAPHQGIGLLTISLGLIGTALILSLFKRFGVGKSLNKGGDYLKLTRQIPCYNCRFFNNNAYLKCAVHPSTVLSIVAKNCPDYWSVDSDRLSQ
ncbi:MAG: hypothetical protein WA919_10620 [Coleofasciculaceae cyanobacterium]